MSMQLELSTVNRKGKYCNERSQHGTIYANLTKGPNTPLNQIAISIIDGSEGHTKPRVEELINITVDDGFMWFGTFEMLGEMIAARDIKNVPAKNVLRCMELYKAYIAEHGLEDDSNNLSVKELLDFVKNDRGFDYNPYQY